MRAILLMAAVLAAGSAAAGDIPVVRLDPVTVQTKLRAVPDKARPAPLQFAVGVPADFTLAHGRWQVDAERARWALAVESPGALSLNFHLSGLRLPDGAFLLLRDVDGRPLHGPYTAAQVRDGELWTPIVPGERALLEIDAPAAAIGDVSLRVAEGFHAFRDPFGVAPKSHDPGLGNSGSCNIDVACPQGDAWRDEIRSVVRVQIAGSGLCSGLLVNNLRTDHRALVLTADHCEIGPDGAGSVDGADADPASVVFYFNLQTDSCGGNAETADITQTVTGSRFLADDVGSDFTLLELLQPIPPHYGVHFAGFDASGAAPASGVSIHHPSGDVKKITPFANPATQTTISLGGSRTVQTWRVVWAEGTTEPGSSGAGLWSQGRRVVGVLSGGDASCGNPNGPDYFGRLDVGWTASTQSRGQLAAHLDPDGCGIRAIDGIDADTVNAVPSAAADNVSVAAGAGSIQIDVLANDSDPDAGQRLRVTALSTTGTRGSARIVDGGLRVEYTAPSSGGADSFRYTVQDDFGACAVTTVSIDVTGDSGGGSGGDSAGGSGGGGALPPALLLVMAAAAAARRRRQR